MKNSYLITLFLSTTFVFAADITDNFDGEAWAHWNMPGAKVKYLKNEKEGINASPCMEISLLPGNPDKKDPTIMKVFPVTPGKEYMATVMMKNAVAEKKGQVLFYTLALNAQGKPLKPLSEAGRSASADWVRLTTYFKTPEGTASVRLHFRVSGDEGSRILFDDVVIKEVSTAEGIVDHFDSLGTTSLARRPEAKVERVFEENDGKESKGCVGVVIKEGNPKKCGGSLMKFISVEKGKEYTFVVYAKSTGFADDTRISMNLQGLDDKRGFLGTGVQGKSIKAEECRDWTRITYTYKVPTTGKWASCANLLVTLGVSGDIPGKVLFDDFEYLLVEGE